MNDNDKPTEQDIVAAKTKRAQTNERGARGNVHSEPDEQPARGAPPPLPH